jgi:hypothetical protein
MACPEPGNKSPFSAFTMVLYLGFKDGWPDLAYGISVVWALDPNLQSKGDDLQTRMCLEEEAI